ncbi:MAG TPA: LuxR C-terminal-related transcriptional regulator [Trebonia sp.]|nr:LuxR C-terminal-related transcriptional regulator [Trebonia sp.]
MRDFAVAAARRAEPAALVVEGEAGAGKSRLWHAAAELFISVRTVETRVASIYRKLGVRGRSELRRVLSQQDSSGASM